MLVYIESLFVQDYLPSQKKDPNVLSFYAKETIAEAISYIIYVHSEIFGIDNRDFGIIDESCALPGKIQNAILDACFIKQLQEFEIYVDHLSYTCNRIGKSLVIEAPFQELEKSIRLGYARNELQSFYGQVQHDHIVSIEQICGGISDKLKLDLVKYTSAGPYPRYRIEFPALIQNEICKTFLAEDRLFREERQYLDYIEKEQLVRISSLLATRIRDNLTVYQFIKIKRFFFLMHLIFWKKFSEAPIELPLLLRSLVPSFSSSEQLINELKDLAPRETLESFLDVITWRPDQGIIFDIQYQPFFKIGAFYSIPLCIFAISNTVRNLFSLEYKKGNPEMYDEGKFDAISELLSTAFSKQGFRTFKSVKYSFLKEREIDFIALKGEILFIAECKRTLLPTNIFEFRTLYDEIMKAIGQLDTINLALSDARASAEIGSKLGIDISRIRRIQTAVITNNRVFAGLTIRGHPIRNVQEVINIIGTGLVRTNDGNYSVWENDVFSDEDLFKYFSDKGLCKYSLDAMNKRELFFAFDNFDIKFTTYYLNAPKALRLLMESSRKISMPS